jgi:carboxyl-terminal processing protease
MSEFRSAVESLGEIEALILDLSSNGGGLFDQSIEMAGYFLPKESLVVSNEGRMIEPRYYRTKEEGVFKGHVAVIINSSSASASEIVAGALQDWDRAIVVGQNSFGKGLVQQQVPLGDGSAVRITVARYHTPTGRAIQRPYEQGHREEYYKNRYKSVDSLAVDSVKDLRPKYKTLLQGREVLGGGGITPDVVVKVDTTQVSDYMVKIVAQGVYSDFILEYMDREREKLEKRYPTFEKFEKEFELDDKAMARLVELCTAKGIEYDQDGYLKSKDLIKDQLSAMVAQRLFSTSEFYRWMNPRQNESYQKALYLLQNWDKEAKKYIEP